MADTGLALHVLVTWLVLGHWACAQDCHQNVSACVPVPTRMCLGAALPFSYTSAILASDSSNVSEALEKLSLWAGLENAPQCWSVVQPFLCSVYLPKCDNSSGQWRLELPSRDLCERTREPCKVVQSYQGWPDFLQCSQDHFRDNCKSTTYERVTFNTTGRCEAPLIRTKNPDSWFAEVEGCGLQCQNPLYTEQEHREAHIFTAIFGTLCLLSTLFTVLTFLVDWKFASRYPALILFFINACFFLGSVGWMAQFAPGARTDITCNADGTVRRGEPKLGPTETASCAIVFVLVYYFMMAGVVWFVMLAYAWYVTFRALGTPRDNLTSKTAYFHLVAWCLPLVLTIVCLALSEVDGDSLTGICFVGFVNHGVRAGFVLVPVSLVLVFGFYFMVRGLATLISIRKEAPSFISAKATAKIRETIFRLGIFTCLALFFVVVTFAVHIYTFANENLWRESFRKYMYCHANETIVQGGGGGGGGGCRLEHKPSLVAVQLHIFAFFGAGIAMSSWSWNRASLAAWERFLRKVFRRPSPKPIKLKRHKMIALAFQRRREINGGRMSLSFHSTHDDPLGMRLELDSESSHELSTDFAANVPRLVRRRGGLIAPVAGTGRRYSDSDIQSSASRRMSQGSELGQGPGLAEIVAEELRAREEAKKKKKKRKKRKRFNKVKPSAETISIQRVRGRRNSDTSVYSHASAHSVHVSVERQSIEAISITSIPHIRGDDLETFDLAVMPQTSNRRGSVAAGAPKSHQAFGDPSANGKKSYVNKGFLSGYKAFGAGLSRKKKGSSSAATETAAPFGSGAAAAAGGGATAAAADATASGGQKSASADTASKTRNVFGPSNPQSRSIFSIPGRAKQQAPRTDFNIFTASAFLPNGTRPGCEEVGHQVRATDCDLGQMGYQGHPSFQGHQPGFQGHSAFQTYHPGYQGHTTDYTGFPDYQGQAAFQGHPAFQTYPGYVGHPDFQGLPGYSGYLDPQGLGHQVCTTTRSQRSEYKVELAETNFGSGGPYTSVNYGPMYSQIPEERVIVMSSDEDSN